jgi:hypothetical protein
MDATVYAHAGRAGRSKRQTSRKMSVYAAALKRNQQMLKCVYAGACHPTRTISNELSTEQRFNALAKKWSEEIGHVSSISDRISHSAYREIIDLGWDVVPYLIADLQRTHRFWFPALTEITTICPFDHRDAGDTRRMTEAWVTWWEKRKKLM